MHSRRRITLSEFSELMGDINEVDPLELFRSDIKVEDLVVRVQCIKHMNAVAHALGKEKALSVFVPLIMECVKGLFCSDDDEMLLAFAQHIPSLIHHLPTDSGAGALVPILEYLASQDETVIREAAVSSLGFIAAKDPVHCNQTCFPALIRLFKSEWFSPRISACAFASHVYSHVSEDSKSQIRALYISCATNEEAPMVRRAAASNLMDFIGVLDKQVVVSEIIPVFHGLAKDETQEPVRTSCVHAATRMCEIFAQEEANLHMCKTVAELATDKSWRVRLAVAKVYGKLCKCLGPQSTSTHLLYPLVELIRDQEPDVRKAAVAALPDVTPLLPMSEVIDCIVPLFSVVIKDPVQQVRAALSACIGELARLLGKEFTVDHLIPLLTEAVKDELPVIRYESTASIGSICEVLQDPVFQKTLNQMISLLNALAQDTNWRTRLAVLEQIPVLCRLHGRDFFESKLENLFLSFFGDSVYAVRGALSDQIRVLADFLGDEWTSQHFLQKVLSLYSLSSPYSTRVAILQTLPKIAGVMRNFDQVNKLIIPILAMGCTDPVANVRFVACSMIVKIANEGKRSGLKLSAMKELEVLKKDADIDVQYFALKALEGTRC
jgi:serine/threonine-protein phosphatase 2A regulatory subunit A